MGKDNDETKDKKQYLWSYQEHVRRIKRIEEELAELRAMKIYPSGKAGKRALRYQCCLQEIRHVSVC